MRVQSSLWWLNEIIKPSIKVCLSLMKIPPNYFWLLCETLSKQATMEQLVIVGSRFAEILYKTISDRDQHHSSRSTRFPESRWQQSSSWWPSCWPASWQMPSIWLVSLHYLKFNRSKSVFILFCCLVCSRVQQTIKTLSIRLKVANML